MSGCEKSEKDMVLIKIDGLNEGRVCEGKAKPGSWDIIRF